MRSKGFDFPRNFETLDNSRTANGPKLGQNNQDLERACHLSCINHVGFAAYVPQVIGISNFIGIVNMLRGMGIWAEC